MNVLPFLVGIAVGSTAMAAGGSSVVGSKHDLSVRGPGPIKAQAERQSCVFCHVPHGGTSRALGARPEIGNKHRPYESTTAQRNPGAPSGATRVCLSCHDGTIAVGQTRTRTIQMNGATDNGRIPATRRSNLGTDLRGTHPVSVTGEPGSRVHAPTDRHVRLDAASQVQCTSCHDPHSEFGGTAEGRFLVRPTKASQLCTSCHEPNRGSHATSSSPFTAAQGNDARYASIAEAGCHACHDSHGADVSGRLLSRRPTDAEDGLCLRCHGGAATGARLNVAREVAKGSAHSVDGSRVHDASEGPEVSGRRLPELSPSAPRHAACVDCHEPHDANSVRAQAPLAPGAMAGTWGIDEAGRPARPARFEYEVCFKCHGDSANKPPASVFRAPQRRIEDRNLRRVFDPVAPSSHPVVAPVRGGDVPSLTARYRPGSLVYCTDCHASDDGPGAGGTGPRGPHGSAYAPLLERNYSTASPGAESPFAYALCYKCHDRNVLLSDRSAFRLHRKHVVERQTPCATCHAAHGVSARAGTPTQNAHLVDFDLGVVRPGRNGALQYERLASRSGRCALTCHGALHDPPATKAGAYGSVPPG